MVKVIYFIYICCWRIVKFTNLQFLTNL